MPSPEPQRPVFVDRREGSAGLAPFLAGYRLPVEIRHMDYADIAFDGHGPMGPHRIGIERKCLGDMLQSMRSGRLSGHQIPGLMATYDTVYVIVEGVYRCAPESGILETFRRGGWAPHTLGTQRFLWHELEGYLATLESKGGVRLRWSSGIGQTAAIVDSLYRWWGKDWARHKALDVVYTPPPPTLGLVEPSLVRKVAVQLPGVGWDKAAAVDERFKSVAEMVGAGVKDWAALKGFGKVLAARVVRCLKGEKP